MRNRILRLAVLAAVPLVIPAAAAFAQGLTLPPRLASKPWVGTARRPSAGQAFDRALATLTPKQRAPAVRMLASTRETLP